MCLPGPLTWPAVQGVGGPPRELVGETYFFRDRGQLEVIRQHVLRPMLAGSAPRRLRLWSAGCSTGEEAYTLAILSLETLPIQAGWEVDVLGTDVNEVALARARAGRYGAWSFRGVPDEARARWFTREGDGFVVAPAVRQLVRFACHDLTSDPVTGLVGERPFDLVLCRNVFIYFSPAEVERAIGRFAEALALDGALVLGHGERVGQAPDGFRIDQHPESMVLRRSNGGGRAITEPGPVLELPANLPAADKVTRPAPAVSRSESPGDQVAVAVEALAAGDRVRAWRVAARLLDQHCPSEAAASVAVRALVGLGRLDEARRLLDEQLARHPVSARLHYLRSLLASEAGDRVTALRALDAVIYLAPDHVAALMDRAQMHAAAGSLVEAIRDLGRASAVVDRHDRGARFEELEAFTVDEVERRCLELRAQLETRLTRSGG